MTVLSAALIGSTGAVLTGLSWAAIIVVSDMWSRSRRLSDHSQRASVDTQSVALVQIAPVHAPRQVDAAPSSPCHPRPLCAASRSRVGLLVLGGCIRRMA